MLPTLRTAVCALAVLIAGSGAAPLLASAAPSQQDQYPQNDRNRDRDRDRDRVRDNNQQDESAYYNNRYYKSGWKDGQKHKQKKNKHWKNDADREAYEAGYTHGDRGDRWQDHNRQTYDRRDH